MNIMLVILNSKMPKSTKSTTTAELVTTSMAGHEVLFTCTLICEFGQVWKQRCCVWAMRLPKLFWSILSVTTRRSILQCIGTTLSLHCHYIVATLSLHVQELVFHRVMNFKWAQSDDKVADTYTKPLGVVFHKQCSSIGLKG
jgi:hypothetical protein